MHAKRISQIPQGIYFVVKNQTVQLMLLDKTGFVNLNTLEIFLSKRTDIYLK